MEMDDDIINNLNILYSDSTTLISVQARGKVKIKWPDTKSC